MRASAATTGPRGAQRARGRCVGPRLRRHDASSSSHDRGAPAKCVRTYDPLASIAPPLVSRWADGQKRERAGDEIVRQPVASPWAWASVIPVAGSGDTSTTTSSFRASAGAYRYTQALASAAT